MKNYYTISQIADIFSIPVKNINSKIENIENFIVNSSGEKCFHYSQIEKLKNMNKEEWELFSMIKPKREYTSIELFTGAGGLALGLEKAGFNHIMLNEFNKNAVKTLKKNRPNWNIKDDDISDLSFKEYKNKDIDLLSGGFPCQAFSYVGKGLGFADIRGTLFYHYARALSEIKPKFFIAENVKGLLTHDNGKTIEVIYDKFKEQGYKVLPPKLFNCLYYKVPQKRERIIIVGIRKDIYNENIEFQDPTMFYEILNLKDTFYKGELYNEDVPKSNIIKYSDKKENILKLVPMGGNWKDLPVEKQIEYLGDSFNKGGGKTGIARRLSIDKPSLTLLCSPMQKQTERCHPTETRPLTIRESARIQTFPDDWVFEGSILEQYKQIGNAVPVNFAEIIGKSLINYMNKMVD